MLRAVIFAEGATNGKPRGERALEGMSIDSQVVSDHEESLEALLRMLDFILSAVGSH